MQSFRQHRNAYRGTKNFQARFERLETRDLLSVQTVLPPENTFAAEPATADSGTFAGAALLAANPTPWAKVSLGFVLGTTPVADPVRNLVYLTDSTNRKVLAVDTDLGRTVAHAPLTGPGRLGWQMAISHDADRLFVGFGDSNKIEVFSLPELEPIAMLTTPVRPWSLVHGPGNKLYVSDVTTQKVWQIDAAIGSGHAIDSRTYWSTAMLRLDANGSKLFASTHSGSTLANTALEYDLPTSGDPLRVGSYSLPGNNLMDFAVDEQSRRIYTASGGTGGISVVDMNTNQRVVWTFGDAAYGTAVAFQPGSDLVYGGSGDPYDGGVHRYRTDGTKLEDILVGPIESGGIEITPNGRLLFVNQKSYSGNDQVGIIGLSSVKIEGIPVARFTASADELNVAFDASASNDYEASGQIVSHAWDFGDGAAASGLQPNHVFSQSGIYNVRLVVTDDQGNSDDVVRQIEVQRSNESPVAEADTYHVVAGGSLSAGIPGGPGSILANDHDPDGDSLLATLVQPTANGALTLNADGSFFYSPVAGFIGTDSFTYRATDAGGLESELANVQINVLPAALPQPKTLYLSFQSSGKVGNLSFTDEDVVTFDGSKFALLFDGSDLGLRSFQIDALAVLGGNDLLLSFSTSGRLPGIAGIVDDADIVRFAAKSLGESTKGTFSLYFDGSDVGLTSSADVDGLEQLDDGRLLLHVTGGTRIRGSRPEDLLVFTPTQLGPVTAGTWSVYFDGSTVGLRQPLDAVAWETDGRLLLSTETMFSVPGLSGGDEDAFIYSTSSALPLPKPFPSLRFDGSKFGLVSNDLTGLDVAPDRRPTSAADRFALPDPRSISVSAANGVLANDDDADGERLVARLLRGPDHGALVLGADGSFTYTPAADFSGIDSFTYEAFDGYFASAPATVVLETQALPTAASNDAVFAASDPVGSQELETLLAYDLAQESLRRDRTKGTRFLALSEVEVSGIRL